MKKRACFDTMFYRPFQKKRKFMIFCHIYFKVWFFFCIVKNKNLTFRIPGFRRNVTNIHIYKWFSCVFHTANTLTCFECFIYIYIYKNIGSFKNMFSHGFSKHNKIIFLHFWILQHVCKTPKGIGQYSKKI